MKNYNHIVNGEFRIINFLYYRDPECIIIYGLYDETSRGRISCLSQAEGRGRSNVHLCVIELIVATEYQ